MTGVQTCALPILISHKKNPPFITDIFKANIFWMGKNNFVKDKKYKLKLVTQEVECEIVAFNKVIDATTLGTYENARAAKTNDVAEVTIKTKEKICFDKFADDQNTGRFVIVDGYDISGGGIVSGLVASSKAIETSFIKDDIKLTINCFDEYYYDIKASVVKKKRVKATQYSIGENVPYIGESYDFNENFDMIAANDTLVGKIRAGKLIDVISLDEYSYEDIAIIDENGFGINLISQNDLEAYIKDFKKGINAITTNKWLKFNKYRTIKFSDIVEETPEYII